MDLKDLLEAQSVNVLLLRDSEGLSGESISFDDFKKSKRLMLKAVDVISEDFLVRDWWLKGSHMQDHADILFKKFDYRMREKRADQFDPDVTLSIHYNTCFPNKVKVDDNGKTFWRDRKTNRNYHMAFVSGAFMEGEIQHDRKRLQFIRGLVTGEIEQSIALAHYFMQASETETGVLPVLDFDDLDYLNQYATQKDIQNNKELNYLKRVSLEIGTDQAGAHYGVAARNLYHGQYPGAVIMGESFCQEAEHLNFMQKNINIHGYKTSTRIKEVSRAYFQAIKKWAKDPLIQFSIL